MYVECFQLCCSSGDLFEKKLDDPTQLISTLRATQIVGIVSLLYGTLLHTDATARGDTPPPPLPASTVAVVRSSFNMLNHIARLYLPLLQVRCSVFMIQCDTYTMSHKNHYCFHWYKNPKNRSINARVIVKNKVACFCGSLCSIPKRSNWMAVNIIQTSVYHVYGR